MSFVGRDLGCIRGERAVFAGLDFSLAAGELLLLVGPNGSGKSSLLRLLAGLLPPAAGELAWDGEPVYRNIDSHRARLHYVGHQDAVKPTLNVRENLSFWAALRGSDVGGDTIEAALAAFALDDLAERPGRLLSAGQKRRLALTRLLIAPAELWLLDEPTVGLDKDSVARLRIAIARHRDQGGRVALATHIELDGAESARLDLSAYRPAPVLLEDDLW